MRPGTKNTFYAGIVSLLAGVSVAEEEVWLGFEDPFVYPTWTPDASGPGQPGGLGTAFTVIASDFNNDELPDLIGSRFRGTLRNEVGGIDLFINDGTGSFMEGSGPASPQNCYSIVSADLNNDGNLDVVYFNGWNQQALKFSASIEAALGNGDGTFQELKVIEIGNRDNGPRILKAGHFTDDDTLDLAVVNNFLDTNQIDVFVGDGAGNFALSDTVEIDGVIQAMDIDQINSDPFTDVVVTHEGLYDIYLGNAEGKLVFFTSQALPPGAGEVNNVNLLDLNDDGILDLLLGTDTSNGFLVFLNEEGETFEMTNVPIGGNNKAFLVDINDDGMFDLVFSKDSPENEPNQIVVFFGNSDGLFDFTSPTLIDVPFSLDLTIADLNGDKIVDLVFPSNEERNGRFYPGIGTMLNRGSSLPGNSSWGLY